MDEDAVAVSPEPESVSDSPTEVSLDAPLKTAPRVESPAVDAIDLDYDEEMTQSGDEDMSAQPTPVSDDDGEVAENGDSKQSAQKSDDGEVDDNDDKSDKEEGELEDGELEDSDDELAKPPIECVVRGRRASNASCQSGGGGEDGVCKWFVKGQCTWGADCKFAHPSQAPPAKRSRAVAAESNSSVASSVTKDETPWERGLRQARDAMRKANHKRENDADYETKRLKLVPTDEFRPADSDDESCGAKQRRGSGGSKQGLPSLMDVRMSPPPQMRRRGDRDSRGFQDLGPQTYYPNGRPERERALPVRRGGSGRDSFRREAPDAPGPGFGRPVGRQPAHRPSTHRDAPTARDKHKKKPTDSLLMGTPISSESDSSPSRLRKERSRDGREQHREEKRGGGEVRDPWARSGGKKREWEKEREKDRKKRDMRRRSRSSSTSSASHSSLDRTRKHKNRDLRSSSGRGGGGWKKSGKSSKRRTRSSSCSSSSSDSSSRGSAPRRSSRRRSPSAESVSSVSSVVSEKSDASQRRPTNRDPTKFFEEREDDLPAAFRPRPVSEEEEDKGDKKRPASPKIQAISDDEMSVSPSPPPAARRSPSSTPPPPPPPPEEEEGSGTLASALPPPPPVPPHMDGEVDNSFAPPPPPMPPRQEEMEEQRVQMEQAEDDLADKKKSGAGIDKEARRLELLKQLKEVQEQLDAKKRKAATV